MTYGYADLVTDGAGKLDYYLLVPGVAVFGTTLTAPSDSWYTDTDLDYHAWLSRDGLGRISDSIDYLTAQCDAKGITVDIVDIDGGAVALAADWRSGLKTWLTSTLTATATSASVEDTTGWADSGDICIGRERATYSAKTGTSFTGLDRSAYGTTAEEHFVDLTGATPIQPVVTSKPEGWEGRRALLYAAAIDPSTGVRGPSTCIYRGIVTRQRSRVGRGLVRLGINHVVDRFYKGTAGAGLGSAVFRLGAYHSADGDFARIWLTRAGIYTPTTAITTGWRSHDAMQVLLNQQFSEMWVSSGGSASTAPYVYLDGDSYSFDITGSGTYTTIFNVTWGSMMWCLGFDAGQYDANGGTITHQAQRDPVRLFVDFSGVDHTTETVAIPIEPGYSLVGGNTYGYIEGLPYAKIVSITGGSVFLQPSTRDDVWPTEQAAWIVEDDDITEIRNCLPISQRDGGRGLLRGVKRLLHLETSQVEPIRWCCQGIAADDVDFDELEDALEGIDISLGLCRTVVVQPTAPYDVVGHQLAALGICPRITTDSKIGFVRISTPTRFDANAVALDEDMWDAQKAADIETDLETREKLGAVEAKLGWNYLKGDGDESWSPPTTLTWREAVDLLGSTRTAHYQIPGICWPGLPAGLVPRALNTVAINCHFIGFGRNHAQIEIPCTATAANTRCGDVVTVTHELAPNLADGEIGLSGELAIVEAREFRHDTGSYSLTVRVGTSLTTGGIAPTARGTDYDESGKTMTCGAHDDPEYAQSGSDLDEFVSTSTVAVLLIERDSATPTTWSATIEASGANTTTGVVTFTAAPMADAAWPAAGVWMIPQVWGSAWTDHKAFAYVASLSTAPALGSDDPMVWTI